MERDNNISEEEQREIAGKVYLARFDRFVSVRIIYEKEIMPEELLLIDRVIAASFSDCFDFDVDPEKLREPVSKLSKDHEVRETYERLYPKSQ